MPDQSLDKQTNPTTASQSASPGDAAPAPQESSTLANAPQASEGQMQQADVTINQDPIVGSAEARQDDYDDEDKHPYRALQQLAKSRDLDASGKRDEIVARLREQDANGGHQPAASDDSTPRGAVDPTNVENGGIQVTSAGVDHASVLQGLSNDRRAQQLAAVKGRASAASSDEG